MFTRWNLTVNDFLGIPHSGWGDGLPTVEIVLATIVIWWVYAVTLCVVNCAINNKSDKSTS